MKNTGYTANLLKVAEPKISIWSLLGDLRQLNQFIYNKAYLIFILYQYAFIVFRSNSIVIFWLPIYRSFNIQFFGWNGMWCLPTGKNEIILLCTYNTRKKYWTSHFNSVIQNNMNIKTRLTKNWNNKHVFMILTKHIINMFLMITNKHHKCIIMIFQY